MNMSLYCACHGKCIFADPLQMSHACHRFWKCYKTLTFCSLLKRCTIPCACHAKRHLNLQKWSEPLVFCTFWLGNVLRATTACTFSTSQLPKVVRTWCVLYFLTSKCASRYNGVHVFDIATSKSGPRLRCFVHFDFEMCFALQRRALFRHLNCQKWSAPGVFCTFWLASVLRATTACNFSSLIWPAGSAPAALASLLFDPPEPQIIGKTQFFATFLPFRASASAFFWPFLFSDLLSSTLSLLSASSLLCFSSAHIVGSLTSKLPSIICVTSHTKQWFLGTIYYCSLMCVSEENLGGVEGLSVFFLLFCSCFSFCSVANGERGIDDFTLTRLMKWHNVHDFTYCLTWTGRHEHHI